MSVIKSIKGTIFSKLRKVVVSGNRISEEKLIYTMRHDALIEKALHCTDMGVTDERLCNEELVVSLTTYGRRIYGVAPTIESIMQGSVKPNRIVLWLDEAIQNRPLPVALQQQQKRGLEVAFCKDVRSYKKLVPTLCKYPEASIITIDDDAIYRYDLIEKLLNEHIIYPDEIIANRIHRIILGDDHRPISYLKWDQCSDPEDNSYLNFFTGVGGVLYPPHSLPKETFNEEVFLNICKSADDIWFYAMSIMAGTHTRKCPTYNIYGDEFVMCDDVQDMALSNENNDQTQCMNDIQFKAVFDRYNLWNKYEES